MKEIKSLAEFKTIRYTTSKRISRIIKEYKFNTETLTLLLNKFGTHTPSHIFKSIFTYQKLNLPQMKRIVRIIGSYYDDGIWTDELLAQINERTMLHLLKESVVIPGGVMDRWLNNKKGKIKNIQLLYLIVYKLDKDFLLNLDNSQVYKLHEMGISKDTLKDAVLKSYPMEEVDDELYNFLNFDSDLYSAERLMFKRKMSIDKVKEHIHHFNHEDILYKYKLDRKTIDKILNSYSTNGSASLYSRFNIYKRVLRTQKLTDIDIDELYMSNKSIYGLWDELKYKLIDIFEYQSPSEEFVSKWTKTCSTSTMWKYISRNKNLSLRFLLNNKEKVHWNEVFAYKPLNPKQIKSLIDKDLVHWGNLSKFQKINMNLYTEYKSKLKHKNLSRNTNLPKNVRELVKKKVKMLKALAR